MDAPRQWIAAALAHAPGTSLQPVPDTSALLVRAADEGVLALLYDKLAGDALAALPSDLAVGLRDAARNAAALELARSIEIRRVADMLATAGIRMLILKGGALAYWLYASPSHRPRGDLDLLVAHVGDAERAVALLQELGYRLEIVRPAETAGFETALERVTPAGLTHRIDLHWRLLNNARLTKGISYDALWQRAIPIPALGAGAKGLGRSDALAHAALHRITNIPSGGHNRLIWIYDVHLLTNGMDEADWCLLLEIAVRGLATPVLDALRASQEAFGTVPPQRVVERLVQLAETEDWLSSDDVDVAVLDRAHLAHLPWSEKGRWLRRKLFPSPAFMRHRYGATGNGGLARAYLVRWWVGIRRGLGWH